MTTPLLPQAVAPVRVIARQPCPACGYVASARTEGRAVQCRATHLAVVHVAKDTP